jgi:hypothetical protein
VAILSTEEFDASTDVDRASLTFGRTGDEQSLAFCFGWRGEVNCDGLRDLICFFRTRDTGIGFGDTEGILKGQTKRGVPLKGSDSVRIVKWWWWWW